MFGRDPLIKEVGNHPIIVQESVVFQVAGIGGGFCGGGLGLP